MATRIAMQEAHSKTRMTHTPFQRVCNLRNLALQLSVSLSVYVAPIFKVPILQLEQRRLRDILNFAT